MDNAQLIEPSRWFLAFALSVLLSQVGSRARAEVTNWKSNGPRAGVDTIAVAPSNALLIYAGSIGTDGGKGVFKSVDAGRSWLEVNNGITNKRINAIAIDPQRPEVVYAGYEGEGFYKTTNGGDSWARINERPLHHGTSIAIDPLDTRILYLGTDRGMFKSVDGGKTVMALANGQPNDGAVVSIVIDPRDHGTLYISKYNDKVELSGIWKSTDVGSRWKASNIGLSGGHPLQVGLERYIDTARLAFGLAIDPVHPNIIYAGTLGGGVFKSTDGGEHWSHASQGINTGMSFGDNIYSLAVDARNPDVVYAGTAGGGIFQTLDGGKHWHSDSQGLPPQGDHDKLSSIIWTLTLDSHSCTIFAGNYGDGDGVFIGKLHSERSD